MSHRSDPRHGAIRRPGRAAAALLLALGLTAACEPGPGTEEEPAAGEPSAGTAGLEAAGADTVARADTVLEADAEHVAIREWKVPWAETRPRDPYVGHGDRVWFVGQQGNYLALLAPGTGEIARYDLPEGTGPHNLIVAPDSTVWFAGNRDAYIGALAPATGEINRHPMPNPDAVDPHTLVFDGQGDIWFTVQGGNFVGKLDTDADSAAVALIEVPTENARPYGIKVDSAGRPWIALLGTNKLATVDPSTMELREIALPRPDAHPRRLDVLSDGTVWYVDYVQGYLGRYDPSAGDFEEWRAPSGAESRPYGMIADGRDRIWFVETGPDPNLLVGFDPAAGEFFGSTPVPSGGGTVRHMHYFAPGDEIWFGADTNTIGRVRLK